MIEFKIDNIRNELFKAKTNRYDSKFYSNLFEAAFAIGFFVQTTPYSLLFWLWAVLGAISFIAATFYLCKILKPIPQLKELGKDLEVKFLFDKRGDLILEEEDCYFYCGEIDGVHIYADRRLKDKDKLMNVIIEYILKEKIKGLTFLKKGVNE